MRKLRGNKPQNNYFFQAYYKIESADYLTVWLDFALHARLCHHTAILVNKNRQRPLLTPFPYLY